MSKADIDVRFMRMAIEEAQKSLATGDVPVGAVIVDESGEILARAHNRREAAADASAHAEISCISDASRSKGSWRLSGCTMYVTLEPCPMCAGAILNSRIGRVVAAAKNPKFGALGSVLDLNSYPLNSKCEVEYGVCGEESTEMLRRFFENKR